jgi:hypothetical protein
MDTFKNLSPNWVLLVACPVKYGLCVSPALFHGAGCLLQVLLTSNWKPVTSNFNL